MLAVGVLGSSVSVIVERRCSGQLEADVLPTVAVCLPTMDWQENVVDLGRVVVGVRVGWLRVALRLLPGFVSVLPAPVAHC